MGWTLLLGAMYRLEHELSQTILSCFLRSFAREGRTGSKHTDVEAKVLYRAAKKGARGIGHHGQYNMGAFGARFPVRPSSAKLPQKYVVLYRT
jgi:hypothetical protein